MAEEKVLNRWQELTSWMVPDIRDKWWGKIREGYASSKRHYHTFDHLQHMFELYDQYKDLLQNRVVVAYAILFHDLMYDPECKSNEAKSADAFKQFSKDTTIDQSPLQSGLISDLILATETHSTDAHMSADSSGTDDIHFFLDFDMAILGADDATYKAYAEHIRKEYSHLSDDEYNAGRAKILKLFLQIPNIYATQVFRDRFEAAARKNIEAEIQTLGG